MREPVASRRNRATTRKGYMPARQSRAASDRARATRAGNRLDDESESIDDESEFVHCHESEWVHCHGHTHESALVQSIRAAPRTSAGSRVAWITHAVLSARQRPAHLFASVPLDEQCLERRCEAGRVRSAVARCSLLNVVDRCSMGAYAASVAARIAAWAAWEGDGRLPRKSSSRCPGEPISGEPKSRVTPGFSRGRLWVH